MDQIIQQDLFKGLSRLFLKEKFKGLSGFELKRTNAILYD